MDPALLPLRPVANDTDASPEYAQDGFTLAPRGNENDIGVSGALIVLIGILLMIFEYRNW